MSDTPVIEVNEYIQWNEWNTLYVSVAFYSKRFEGTRSQRRLHYKDVNYMMSILLWISRAPRVASACYGGCYSPTNIPIQFHGRRPAMKALERQRIWLHGTWHLALIGGFHVPVTATQYFRICVHITTRSASAEMPSHALKTPGHTDHNYLSYTCRSSQAVRCVGVQRSCWICLVPLSEALKWTKM